jgi:cytochrome P450
MVDYNPFHPAVIADPHKAYKQLRQEAPVYFLGRSGDIDWNTWFFSRFDDIWEASMDAEHYSTEAGTTIAQLVTKVQPLTPMLNNMDPPRHTKLRSGIAAFFTPGKVRKLQPQIQQFVDDAWDEIRDRKEVDVFHEFATKISVKVACLANGFPMEDSDMLNDLVWRFFGREEGVDGMTADGVAAMNEMFGYFAELVGKRRAAGADLDNPVDLTCRFHEDGANEYDVMSASSHLSLFLIGGAETFPKTFGSAVHRLWEHPDQRAQCAADPGLIPEAYKESLRYDMPTQFLMRQVVKPIEVRGQQLEPGHNVAFLYPSANRDENEFESPDTFDIHRKAPRMLTFGHGVHACIGHHFAKMEGKLCIEKLLAEAPEYQVKADELQLMKTEFVQGWETMPVVLQP